MTRRRAKGDKARGDKVMGDKAKGEFVLHKYA